jgi:hypothetical protein
MQEISKITFTPLKRNRFRCNQTGKVVKKAQTKRIGLQTSNPEKKRMYSLYVGSQAAICPACKEALYFNRYENQCTCSNGHTIRLIR